MISYFSLTIGQLINNLDRKFNSTIKIDTSFWPFLLISAFTLTILINKRRKRSVINELQKSTRI